ncbi:RelA/SpoT family protein [Xylanibacter rodentium]|jgi:GTP pyrophosphokinase|uniref:Bifunctional (P)ppGpp synthetase/guanosine-3',5'-bis(Diphosphate) 3'-pyrophosphohydrolase n=6 Tax=Xylanibacter rodentium TaxID=2736289 RepID=A0ABX2AQS9_9BACT|nr:RelA/SpoT family protein [Xylanibacter rodentium]NPE10270.1 bifunctional (p)ppGpp synthetase/guanosine-3',5'-bis(diphosphate) 3'-pyrophosphohydrolase [Prevotella sp. PJ1A]NPE12911.1 bifunctional (p)ppGpp synthetase/guanosine-3',5'-bis(diphosphate) 3'-pyrophosphohydrolase [Xylanibacter rodentium]NPE39157.1 bifunctional (p)ppGpp synthetase/guanosine-3',5'-bis(diphosphate) 3'-pyrophosphohydrolase [Prevotella sp. PCJ2]
MTERFEFTVEEKESLYLLYAKLKRQIEVSLLPDDESRMCRHLEESVEKGQVHRDAFGHNPILFGFQTALIVVEEIGLKRDAVLAILLHPSVDGGFMTVDEVRTEFGESVARILHGLIRISELYAKNPVVESENFRNLLLSFAEDMRVILIMIAYRVNLMRQIRDSENYETKRKVSEEAAYLYAPLAHKLGLYKLKSELEDLSLKYLEHDAYYMIKDKLNATKQARDAYIDGFIGPIKDKLQEAGLRFHMKGRTKSIHSIWQKMKKQKCGFEGIYDLFAIRIIIDSPLEKEKMQCWQAYSIITDMYQPNPKRLRDWLSVPKSNGYESLHITVLGPEKKWVEVQIRTERMDEIAERGVAAHWRYKGVKGETNLDEWLTSIRNILETSDDLQVMDQFKMDLYEDEVFVFTPKGDLLKFPKGATVLDFAYHIHSKIGNGCTGARINNKVVTFREPLRSGDQIEVMTSTTQKPKRDWLNIVKTSRAKSKIRLALKETQVKEGLFAKEMLERKFKNRKIEQDESLMARLVKKLGFKEVSDFYKQIVDGSLDVNVVIDTYVDLQNRESGHGADGPARSAEEFCFQNINTGVSRGNDDVLVIDRNLKGIDYQLARCCNPIYGDDVFGFVTINGGIKIHRTDCPNAPEMRKRFGYRVVRAKWSGKGTSQYSITLRIIGNDDIGIVNNLTSIISKDEKLTLRSISIDSNDGLFRGNLVVMIDDTSRMEALIRKLRTVKGVKQVERI